VCIHVLSLSTAKDLNPLTYGFITQNVLNSECADILICYYYICSHQIQGKNATKSTIYCLVNSLGSPTWTTQTSNAWHKKRWMMKIFSSSIRYHKVGFLPIRWLLPSNAVYVSMFLPITILYSCYVPNRTSCWCTQAIKGSHSFWKRILGWRYVSILFFATQSLLRCTSIFFSKGRSHLPIRHPYATVQ
jgi:hypothetical protein